MQNEEQEVEFYERIIYDNEAKFYQLRLVFNEFRGKQYVHIRKYFLTYEGEYQASKEGVSMEASMHNILSLVDGLLELCSKEESVDIINKHFSDKILALRS